MNSDEVKLKPCPFCGGDGYAYERPHGLVFEGIVECGTCGCEVRALNEVEAVKQWNTRPNTATPADDVVELIAELRRIEHGALDNSSVQWTAKKAADYLAALPPAVGERLWLWRNFVEGRPEHWAFDNPFPCDASGDPITLGQPCGWALFKQSENGRPDVTTGEVERAMREAALNASTQGEE